VDEDVPAGVELRWRPGCDSFRRRRRSGEVEHMPATRSLLLRVSRGGVSITPWWVPALDEQQSSTPTQNVRLLSRQNERIRPAGPCGNLPHSRLLAHRRNRLPAVAPLRGVLIADTGAKRRAGSFRGPTANDERPSSPVCDERLTASHTNRKEARLGQDLLSVFGWDGGRDEPQRRMQTDERRGRRSTA
jgi:hypothetical protein